MRHERHKILEILFDIIHERGTARTCKEAFFGKFFRLCVGNHIRAESRLDNGMKTKFFQSRDDLSELCVSELARHRRRNYCEHLKLLVLRALFQNIDDVYDIRLIRDRAERALIHARTARDTF